MELLPEVQLLVSSEPYGEFVAQYMNIEHIVFDPARSRVPISGTMIRKNPWVCWEYLPEAVKPYYHRKLVILGTESTGKTTLAQELALRFQANWVPEAGRDLIPDSTNFSINDLYAVADAHTKCVVEALTPLPALLILDTDIYITQSYAHFRFGQYLELPDEWYETQKAHLYLYLDKDAPYIQDGSRMPEAERNLLDASHKATLEHFDIGYELLSGDWDLRRKKALFLVANMLFSTF
jgi:HTH-type transcriptional repressor of NAD biosynthesis genes